MSDPTEDVAALVAKVRAGLDAGESEIEFTEQARGLPGDPPDPAVAIIRDAREALAALEVSSRTVAPNREAIARWFASRGFAAADPHEWADALLAADLWQPAPIIDRDAVVAVIDAELNKAGLNTNGPPYSGDGNYRWPVAMELRDRLADALLASGWQPASPRTVTTVEELDALPAGSVIRNVLGEVYERYADPASSPWRFPGWGDNYATHEIALPTTVLYVPSEGVES